MAVFPEKMVHVLSGNCEKQDEGEELKLSIEEESQEVPTLFL